MQTRINRSSKKASRILSATTQAVMDGLETRTLMAGNPLGVSVVKNVLTINGSGYNDAITVAQSGNRWTVTNGSWRKMLTGNFAGVSVNGNGGNDLVTIRANVPTTLYGGNGNDSLIGGSQDDLIVGGAGNDREVGMNGNDWIYGSTGNDRIDGANGDDNIFGGAGNDYLAGGNGDDVIVSVGGGGYDSIFGASGTDSFWTDDNISERIYDASFYEEDIRAIHKIDDFAPAFGYFVSKELNGQDLDDPYLIGKATGYSYFGNHELFSSAGPTIDDVNQGGVGDCYFLSQLASYAMTNPQIIRQAVVDLGDGTFAVRFQNDGADNFYRVDGDLPVNSAGALAYAGLGDEGSVWVAVMEKAWTFARRGDGDYASIESGFMNEVANALGKDATLSDTPTNGNVLLNQIEDALAEGLSVTVGTRSAQPAGSPMVELHAYTVVSVWTDTTGNRWLIVRNPWGIDGYSSRDGVDDGYVGISAVEAARSLDIFVVAQT